MDVRHEVEGLTKELVDPLGVRTRLAWLEESLDPIGQTAA
jgi:hypothetical protein